MTRNRLQVSLPGLDLKIRLFQHQAVWFWSRVCRVL